jgi:DnaK suppressor protein
MYNPGLFFPRQESKMPAKKAASKKRRKTTASRKKVTTKKASTRKKVAKKKAASRKKAPARKKVTRKKASRKKVTKKKASKKKVTKKKVAKKKPSRKKVTKKKVAKKKASRKKVTKKKVTKKKVTKKKVTTKKKVAKKAVSTKKRPSKKKAVSKKRPVVKKKVPAGRPAPRKVPTRKTAPRRDVLTAPIHGIAPYKPKRGEDYMSDAQLEHFRKILSAWKRELMYEVDRTVHHMQDEAANFPDPNDRATQESEFGLELRTRDRERKLLRKIDSALARIDEGSYGFCEETGEEIGLKRLEARPVATLCLEAQERRELAERQFRDRDDRYR